MRMRRIGMASVVRAPGARAPDSLGRSLFTMGYRTIQAAGDSAPFANSCAVTTPRRDSRRAIQIVAAQMTAPPTSVLWLGTSANISHPIAVAQTRSRNLTDCVDEMSALRNERVRQ